MSACPAPGCARVIPREMVFCRYHWWKLPEAMRKQLWALRLSNGTQEFLVALTKAREFLTASVKVRATLRGEKQ